MRLLGAILTLLLILLCGTGLARQAPGSAGISRVHPDDAASGGRLTAEARYVYVLTPRFNHYNSRGDVTAQLNGSGDTAWTASYQADGLRTTEKGSSKDRQKANTKEEDPTGLLNEGFRYRDLETGVFLSRDPLGFVDGPNVYTYVRQNPWSAFDPKGLATLSIPGVGQKEESRSMSEHIVGDYGKEDPSKAAEELSKSIADARIDAARAEKDAIELDYGIARYEAQKRNSGDAVDLADMSRLSQATALAHSIMKSDSMRSGPDSVLEKSGVGPWLKTMMNGHANAAIFKAWCSEVSENLAWSAVDVLTAKVASTSRTLTAIGEARSVSMAANKLPIPGVCFVAGTEIETEAGEREIESLRIGERVTTTDGDSSTEVDPATWRKITLRMLNPECPSDVLDLELLRSVDWMVATGCQPGARMWFELDEMGLRGWADVQSVGEYPAIQPGRGRVVLATVTHYNTFVMEVRLEGQAEPLRPTDRHRLFSVTRNDWVPTASLQPGEELRTAEGTARIASVQPWPGTHRVFNIEVETEHSYFAGKAKVLSHNANPCAQASREVIQNFGSFNEARAAAVKSAGLGDDIVPFVNEIGPLKGRVTGSMSPDGLKGWRLDWGDNGFHVNWWDRTGGAKRINWNYGANQVPSKSYGDFGDLLDHAFPKP